MQPKVKLSKKPITFEKKKTSPKTSNVETETGNTTINGKDYFYSKKDGVTTYFDNAGHQVDENGVPLSSTAKKNPKFLYNGKQILKSTKATLNGIESERH